MTYRGKAISPEELFELGEKADYDKIDFQAWHTGMRLLPEMMQGGGAVE